jgi:hypothetical protein
VPYCRNCGAKIDDDARFCRVCGTPVAPVSAYAKPATPVQTRRRARRTGFPLAATGLIILLVSVLVAVVVAFLPYQKVSFNQSNEASAGNVDSLRLIVGADIANVNVIFRDLPGNQRATTNVSATGWRGIFGADRPLALAFNETTNSSTLTYSVSISRAGGWPVFNMLDVVCDIYIDPSVTLGFTIRTTTGLVMMDASREATFQSLDFETTTGSIEVKVGEGVTIGGDFSLTATTGSVQLLWDEAKVSRSIPVNLRATTGSVEVNITQTRQLAGNVTLNAEATTGGVNLAMDIRNDVGARISASTILGGINVEQQGFSGNEAPLQSSSYPAGSNFDVTLRATTGGIDINAVYQLGGTRS